MRHKSNIAQGDDPSVSGASCQATVELIGRAVLDRDAALVCAERCADRGDAKVAAMSESTGHEHEITVKGGSFALSDLGHLLPGMAEIMPLIGERIWKCYYAGKARNKPLAKFQLSEAVNLMEKGAILRPKYAEDMDIFTSERVSAVRKCIESEDWDGFEPAFSAMIETANGYHEKYDKGFLRWKMPDQPPPELDMTPGG